MTVLTDFGPMLLRPGDELLTPAELSRVAAQRYARGEDLASASGRVLSRKERLG